MLKSKYKGIWWWILATIALGTLWHFVYQLSGDNFIVGMIAPINESVWEHLKIVFFPFIIIGLLGHIIIRPHKTNYWTGQLVGSLAGMLVVFFGFYLYSSIFGESLIIDILLYYVSIIIAMFVAWWIVINTKKIKWLEAISIVGLVLISIILIYLTISPPSLSPFIEESSGQYGIYKNQSK
jgi:hypothetical protein